MAEQYIEFNVEALQKVVAQSINQKSIAHMQKLAEGSFNRVLLLTMNDGLEIIIKILYSITEPRKLATESEVAMLDYLCLKGILMPKVYTWFSEKNNNVRTEYIIMERAEQTCLVTSYVDIEQKIFLISFSCYGSIYYKTALPWEQQADLYSPGVEDSDSDTSQLEDHRDYLPLLMAAGNPPTFENLDPELPKDYSKPLLPEDYEAGHPWTRNIITPKGALIRVINHWAVLMSTQHQKHPCPIQFDTKDEEEFYELEEKWFKINILVEHWRSLRDDMGQDGWLKKKWIDEAEDEEDLAHVEHGWPFQDHEEDD
uniref:Aminoglycoside phosphotransferase domain-containing protein n=1 Tax=Coccidioides posadasii RMSCC 3488 TaxID=454284 RepID=A0A0J6F3Z9_COCPO|nr:hypothetical protein CPAG_01235 [Coccidioides posadasii RMSCC 3488]